MEALNYFTVESDEGGASLVCTRCDAWLALDSYTLGDMLEYALSHTYRKHED